MASEREPPSIGAGVRRPPLEPADRLDLSPWPADDPKRRPAIGGGNFPARWPQLECCVRGSGRRAFPLPINVTRPIIVERRPLVHTLWSLAISVHVTLIADLSTSGHLYSELLGLTSLTKNWFSPTTAITSANWRGFPISVTRPSITTI